MDLWAGSLMKEHLVEFSLLSLDIGSYFYPPLSRKGMRGGERSLFRRVFWKIVYPRSVKNRDSLVSPRVSISFLVIVNGDPWRSAAFRKDGLCISSETR